MTRAPPCLPVPDLDHLTLRQPPDSRMMSAASGLAAMKLMNSWRSASAQIPAVYRTKTGVSATVPMPHATALPYCAQGRAHGGSM